MSWSKSLCFPFGCVYDDQKDIYFGKSVFWFWFLFAFLQHIYPVERAGACGIANLISLFWEKALFLHLESSYEEGI